MNKCAVVIGVNKTGGLPILGGAAQGAEDFANWARSQNFEVELLTDKNNNQVLLADIKAAAKRFIDQGIYEQMLIYFAGHGIMTSPTDENWLLSNAPDDPNEAISCYSTGVLAQISGIPHVVIISDACRTGTADPLAIMISGGSILPNRNAGRADVDKFWATRPGNPALEVRNDESDPFKGIFTYCILKGLNGEIPEVIDTLPEGTKEIKVVFPYELKQFLEEEVPLMAEEANIRYTQEPFIEVVSHRPKYLSRINDLEKYTLPRVLPKIAEEPRTGYFAEELSSYGLPFHPKTERDSIDREQQNKLLGWYQTGKTELLPGSDAGFSITGSSHFTLLLDHGTYEILHGLDSENHLIGIKTTLQTKTLLFIGADGTGTPLAVLHGFIGSIMIENNRIVDINYVPTKNNERFRNSLIRSKEILERRAAASVAVMNGMFQIDGDPEQMMYTASYLRSDKAFDPVLGIYASYAYAQAGDIKGVKSVFDYMAREPEPVIYDVKLLSTTLSDTNTDDLLRRHAPFCPMLSQGWSFLSINKHFGNEIQQFNKYLIPGLWTTFNREGVAILRTYLKSNNR
jgi:hypothetical protein